MTRRGNTATPMLSGRLILAAIVVAIASSGVVVAAATFTGDASGVTGDVSGVAEDATSSGVMPPIDGAKPVFSDQVRAAAALASVELADDTSVTFTKATDSAICFDVALGDGTKFSGCDARETIATGFAYVEIGNGHEGTVDVFGVVPDDVAAVEINKLLVPVRSNVWHYSTRATERLAVRVTDDEGTVAER